jgi:serine/threonine-protein kinase RsbW
MGEMPTARLVIDSGWTAVRDALNVLCTSGPLRDLAEDERGTAELVLAEVLNNLVEHAYAAAPGKIEITLCHSDQGLRCQIVDTGLPMPDNALPKGELPEIADCPLEALPEGGFGWYLIRALSADLNYVRTAGQNRLSFTLPANTPTA